MIALLLMFLRVASAASPAKCQDNDVRYVVLVESDLPEPNFAAEVVGILGAADGWNQAAAGDLCYDPVNPNFAVLLAWPDTVDEMCSPHKTNGDVSCSRNGRAVINWKRWLNGSSGWSSVGDYRRYVINHEVGHVLGMGHRHCPDDESLPTPVMRQQTSRRHASCPRNSRPTVGEIEAMGAKKRTFARMRRRTMAEPWERPPGED